MHWIVLGMILPRQENIMRLPRYPWALLFLIALLPGCGPTAPRGTPPTPPAPSAPSAPPAPGACAAPDACAVPGAGTVLMRSNLTHNDLHHNSLHADALARNAYLRSKLAQNPLNDETFRELQASTTPESVDFRRQLEEDPDTRKSTMELMEYVISCALPLDPTLTIGKPFDERWMGELGLCAGWANLAPGPKCLELVSSCVLSRVNARDRKVIISLRGEPDGLFSLLTQVPVEQELREKGGTLIRSFRKLDECAGEPLPKDPAARDCGFQPLYVGRCNAGEPVTVCTGSNCDCKASISDDDKNVSLRVCKGLYGCDSGPFDPAKYDDRLDPALQYAGWLANSRYTCLNDQPRPTVTFTCPTNGPLVDSSDLPDGKRYGYYSVMIGPGYAASGTSLADVGDDVVATTGTYPASEVDVFTYREGAFYGNLFSDAQITVKNTPRALSGDAYACFGKEWSDGLATLTDRFCAGTSECFHHAPTPCFHSWSSWDARCASDRGMPGEFYQNCNDSPAGSNTWTAPITVYLNHPCDLVDPKACNIGKTPGVPPQQPPPPQ
jgi:hypothetical protein